MAVDVLAVCAHPDDAELGCAGLLLRCKAAGARVGVVDLTRGELGSRGNAALRNEERARASAILGLDVRLDLDLPDGFVERTAEYRTRLVEVIRSEQPRMLVGPYWEDHHPGPRQHQPADEGRLVVRRRRQAPRRSGRAPSRGDAVPTVALRCAPLPDRRHQRAVRHQGARRGVLRLATCTVRYPTDAAPARRTPSRRPTCRGPISWPPGRVATATTGA